MVINTNIVSVTPAGPITTNAATGISNNYTLDVDFSVAPGTSVLPASFVARVEIINSAIYIFANASATKDQNVTLPNNATQRVHIGFIIKRLTNLASLPPIQFKVTPYKVVAGVLYQITVTDIDHFTVI